VKAPDRYSLTFLPEVRADVAWMIIEARDSEYLSECIVRIDGALRTAPLTVGEGRESDVDRCLFEGPLTVFYEVDRDAAAVVVTAVFRVR